MKKGSNKRAKRRGGVVAFTKRDLILKISRQTDLTQDIARVAVQNAIDIMVETLLEGRVIEFRDFGVFEPVVRKARVGRNPRKPQDVVEIPDRKSIKFRVGRKLKARLDEIEG